MPLELADWLVRLSGGSTIIDPFAGSGTTGLAARNNGRRAILIDLESKYCELAAERLAQQALTVPA
jgi:site-specific DNA-methyltransferase (adenine-specific)